MKAFFNKVENLGLVNVLLELVYWKYRKVEGSETQFDDTVDGILNTLLVVPIFSAWPLPIPIPFLESWVNE